MTIAKTKKTRVAFATLSEEDLKRLHSFRIPDELIAEAGVCRVDSAGARQLGLHFGDSRTDLGGRVYPYKDENGDVFNARLRRDNPERNVEGKPENKYISRSHARRGLYWPPHALERLNQPNVEAVLVEAETSALAGMAYASRSGHKLFFVATGGCLGWRDKETGTVADLGRLRGRKVHIMLDSNVSTNPSVQDAELALAAHLVVQVKVAEVKCYRLPPDVNGPDDFLAAYKDLDFKCVLDCPVEPWLDRVGESYEDYEAAKPPTFLIKDFLQSEGATIIGGLAGHGKTFILLSMILSLLTGKPLFGHFDVLDKAKRVIYLSPEITLGSFKKRAERFGLGPYIKSRQLLVRTLSAYPSISLKDPALLIAARGADVFLDPAVRFMEGDESSATDNDRGLAAGIFGLLTSGARSVTCTHHSPKTFEKAGYMALETVLRGSGDIGAMASVVFGVRMIDRNKTLVHVENIKARDFEFPAAFQIKGDPHIDQGRGFQMELEPGSCGPLSEYLPKKSGRPLSVDRAGRLEVIEECVQKEFTPEQTADVLEDRGLKVPKISTLKTDMSKARTRLKEQARLKNLKPKWVPN